MFVALGALSALGTRRDCWYRAATRAAPRHPFAYPDGVSDVDLLPLRALVEANRHEIRLIAARHKGRAVALIGSVARGEETPDSDIDLLIEFDPGNTSSTWPSWRTRWKSCFDTESTSYR
ncbi:MAG: nucleotidyltransferase family protein [Acidimicrobiales bacterium]